MSQEEQSQSLTGAVYYTTDLRSLEYKEHPRGTLFIVQNLKY